jgi:hypothetical protein
MSWPMPLVKMNTNYHLCMCFNYFAQKLIANTRSGDLDLTMLHQMSCQAHVDALLHSEDNLKELCDILEPGDMAMDQ